MPQGYTYYNNYFTKDFRWSTPPDYQEGIGHLNRDEVQVCIYIFLDSKFIVKIDLQYEV